MKQSGWSAIGFALVATAIFMQTGCRVRTAASLDRGADVTDGPREIAWPVLATPDRDDVVRTGEQTEAIPVVHDGPGRLFILDNEVPGETDLEFEVRSGLSNSVTMRITGEPESRSIARILVFGTATTTQVTLTPPDGSPPVTKDMANPETTILMVAEPVGTPRGLILFQASLGVFTAGENAVVRALRDRGWIVAWCSPSFRRLATMIEAPDLETLAQSVSRLIDEDLAHRAYAMDALLRYLQRERPELASLPTVALGCSAGAISLPAMVARMPETIDAAVLVAGGADLFTILSKSTLMRDEFSVQLDGRPLTRAETAQLNARTLELSQLDPYATAPGLRHIPVLMLHAMFDAIVPARTGDVLHDRAGRPERWSYPVGHLGLFVLLASQAEAIADWVEQAVF